MVAGNSRDSRTCPRPTGMTSIDVREISSGVRRKSPEGCRTCGGLAEELSCGLFPQPAKQAARAKITTATLVGRPTAQTVDPFNESPATKQCSSTSPIHDHAHHARK